jgi:type IV pilus assembly protein PilE
MTKQKAFTLIEVMIVVTIIGILAAIGFPSYQNSVKKSRRSDAKAALIGFANAMERYYTENNTFCDAGGAGGTGANSCGAAGTKDTGKPTIFATQSPIDGTTKFYDLTINSVSQTIFNLRATPIGAQNGDGILELSNTQSRGRWDRNNDGDFADTNEDSWD